MGNNSMVEGSGLNGSMWVRWSLAARTAAGAVLAAALSIFLQIGDARAAQVRGCLLYTSPSPRD